MKRWIAILILALLLTGCANPDPAPTVTPTDPDSTQQTDPTGTPSVPTEPTAITKMPLDAQYDAVAAFGSGLLLSRENSLSLWSFGSAKSTATAEVSGLLLPGSGTMRILKDSIVYYEGSSNTLVYLNEQLTETKRLQLNETILADPYLTADGCNLYYCHSSGIRVLDLQTGISRNLKLQEGNWLGITGALLDGNALRCQLQQAGGSVRTMLISTETGQTLWEGDELNAITGFGDLYCYDAGSEWIFGMVGQQPQLLNAPGAIALPQISSAVAVTVENGVTLELYDLTAGRRTASQQIPELSEISGLTAFQDALWFFGDGNLWRWDPSMSNLQDDTVYTEYRYTADAPDIAGLNAMQAQANDLAEQYGVHILMWTDAATAEPAGYTFGIEHRTDVYASGLAALETALSHFPSGMPGRAADWTADGELYIVLVSSITTPSETAYQTLSGMEYLLDGKVYIVLELGENLEQSFYHAMYHVIDPLVLSNSIAYYKWNDLNPSKFQYDNDYIKNLNRDGSKYLEGTRYFIDTYSMSFAVEDRARIFEYAMMSGNESYFESKPMQAKLKMLCAGLREVFQLELDSYPWEQYLK